MNHELIEKHCIDIKQTGSSVICNPAPTGTDIDFVVLTKPDEFWEVVRNLFNADYAIGGSEVMDANDEYAAQDQDGFTSFKKGLINYIVTKDKTFFENFVHATNIAQKLNLLNKKDRVALFQIILYDNWGDE